MRLRQHRVGRRNHYANAHEKRDVNNELDGLSLWNLQGPTLQNFFFHITFLLF